MVEIKKGYTSIYRTYKENEQDDIISMRLWNHDHECVLDINLTLAEFGSVIAGAYTECNYGINEKLFSERKNQNK
jgi:hypothetical protein